MTRSLPPKTPDKQTTRNVRGRVGQVLIGTRNNLHRATTYTEQEPLYATSATVFCFVVGFFVVVFFYLGNKTYHSVIEISALNDRHGQF